MELNVHVADRPSIEKFISVITLGIVEAIKAQTLSIHEATNYFLSPYTAQVLEEMGVDAKLIELVLLGCELEDVERLIPEKLNKSLEVLEKMTMDFLKTTPAVQLPTKYWLEK